ncbi:hypothetical protein P0Y35_16605 [Kiritimatiellaeota bacterium B1221]|nr:hypothetical protein [Kiritimatiellaeota bacterium B1221]
MIEPPPLSLIQDLRQHWRTEALGPIFVRHFRAWWWNIPRDPWSEEVASQIQDEEAMMVCHHCLEAYKFAPDFCPKCGTAIGPYNNVKPFERIFSLGEMFRNGVGPNPNLNLLMRVGYILAAWFQYGLFAPLYFFRMIGNKRKERSDEDESDS